MADLNLEITLDSLAESMSRWSSEEVIELLKKVDDAKGEWDFIIDLKKWVDGEDRKLAQEEVDDKSERESRCVYSDRYSDISAHSSPHKKCVLR